MKLQTIDIETIGRREGDALRPWEVARNSWILCYAISIDSLCAVSDTIPLNDLLCDADSILCGWNMKFDLAFLIASGAQIKNTRFLDGMLLLKRLAAHNPKYVQNSYSLKPTLERYAEHINGFVTGYSADIEFKPMTPDQVTPEFLDKMAEYCQRDTCYTHELIKYLIPLAPKQVLIDAIIESTASVLFSSSVVVGQEIDKDKLQALLAANISEVDELEQYLGRLGLHESAIRSSKQLSTYLTSIGIKCGDLTAKGNVSVSKHALKSLLLQIPAKNVDHVGIVKNILELKEHLTERDKFLLPASELECSHADVFMNSTYTGRLTYYISQTIKKVTPLKNGKIRESKQQVRIGLPLHQFKRGELRSIIKPPEGYKLVEIDFSGQEMRLMAAIANETTMLRLFNEDKDLHSYTGASIANVPYGDFEQHPEFNKFRQLGKVTNLALQYRLSAQGLFNLMRLTYGLDVTLQQVTEMRQKYLALYPGIQTYWDSQSYKARHEAFVTNMAGRRHWFKQGAEDWERCQQAINFPIQSTGAEQKLLFLASAFKFIKDNEIILGWDLHDGLYFYVPELTRNFDGSGVYFLNTLDTMTINLAGIAENLDYKKYWGWEPPLKFPVEVKIGDNWGELKKLEIKE